MFVGVRRFLPVHTRYQHLAINAARWCCTSGGTTQAGYFRTHPSAVVIADHMFETVAVRGSGPGGQGCQSSSNKVELRVKLDELRHIVDSDSFDVLLKNEERRITSDKRLLIVSSHEHRSAAQNKASCLEQVREMVKQACWAQPTFTAVPESTLSQRLINSTKQKRWKESAMRKARQQIRSGKF
jgi:protein subunit release factor B